MSIIASFNSLHVYSSFAFAQHPASYPGYQLFNVIKLCLIHASRYTSKTDATYAIALEWPSAGMLNLSAPIPTASTTVTLLGLPDVKLSWKTLVEHNGIMITVPHLSVAELPCKWAWVFKMTDIK